MFALVALFYHINQKKPPMEKPKGLERFIAIKKVAALSLSILLIALAVIRLIDWGSGLAQLPVADAELVSMGSSFFHDMFSLMIFTDVLILLVSMNYTARYEQVFRNAGSSSRQSFCAWQLQLTGPIRS